MSRSKPAVIFAMMLLVGSVSSHASDWNQIPGAQKLGQTKWSRSWGNLQNAVSAVHGAEQARTWKLDENNSLAVAQRIEEKEVETTKFQSYYKGIEVMGAMVLHHWSPESEEFSDFTAKFDLDAQPRLSAYEAIAISKLAEGDKSVKSIPELKILPNEDQDSARLVYAVTLLGTESEPGSDLIVDANDGHVIARTSHWMTIAPIEVKKSNSKCQTLDANGRPIDYNASLCTTVISNGQVLEGADEPAKKAASNSQKVLEFYSSKFSRNSFDNLGSTVTSVVHIGNKFSNAFWDRSQSIMAYGDGDGKVLGNFTKALDVAGHEMTHGVVSATAKLDYFGESGALNEAFADYFGVAIANNGTNWVIGKDIFVDSANAEGIRDLANPGSLMAKYLDAMGNVQQKPYPTNYSEKFPVQETCDRSNDNCWVHINSTIPSHASYLVTKAIGAQKAQRLYYITLTQYLTSTATFKKTSSQVKKVCAKLFDAATCTQVKNAYASIGL